MILYRKFVVLALAAALAFPLAAQGKGRRRQGSPKPSAAQAAAPAPAQPAVLTPEQMPAAAPQVTYRDGLLSISAENATLGAVLRGVCARTGASVDMPAGMVNDRVAVQLGPGDPRDVVSALLQGSRFDYILLGSEHDPAALAQIILTPRTGGAAAPAVASTAGPVPPAPSPGNPVMRPPTMPPDEAEPAETEQVEPAPVPEPVSPEPTAVPDQSGAQPSQTPPVRPSQMPPVKSPQQFLQELQRMQQQRMEQQQKRQPPPGL